MWPWNYFTDNAMQTKALKELSAKNEHHLSHNVTLLQK